MDGERVGYTARRSSVRRRRWNAALAAIVATLTQLTSAQIEGVVLIDQTGALAGAVTADDAAGFPVTLSRPGSYRLSGNLTVDNPDTTAIEITADDVTLDLNGFTIQGPFDLCFNRLRPIWCRQNREGVGILARRVGFNETLRVNTTILRGTVRAMARMGVFVGEGARIEELTIEAHRVDGISAQRGSRISNSIIRRNGGRGVFCVACLLLGNTILENRGVGIRAIDVLYGDNLLMFNNSNGNSGIQVNITNGIQGTGNVCVPEDCL